ncbi:YheC/YheD family protein [Brevibacillus choshinensis]|uniref:YheC/YheD family protein n=1 Tax=Brevibacillus choshinensis TaxID=54911 RepID=UPI002E1AEAD4|nr:YheC/YheD family protein [Brevibacillus choshinensis]
MGTVPFLCNPTLALHRDASFLFFVETKHALVFAQLGQESVIRPCSSHSSAYLDKNHGGLPSIEHRGGSGVPNNSSKWELYRFFNESEVIRPYLPPTRIFSYSALNEFLSSYGSTYIKPDKEHTGKGIIKVWKNKKKYRFKKETGKERQCSTIDHLYRKLTRMTHNKLHIIQKTIPMARIKKRRFDIRVMMMRDIYEDWNYVGMIAKVAGPGSIINNVRRGGGYVKKADAALLKCFPNTQVEKMISEMIDLCYRICNYFNGFKKSWQIGIDLSIDRRGKIHLIEINYEEPSHHLFRRLKDKTMYNRIRRMAKRYKKGKR